MNLQELIEEYKDKAIICSKTDFSNTQSVDENNSSVKRMYEIIDLIKSQFGFSGIKEFSKLLDTMEYDINVWSATHMLEKMGADKEIREKALDLIRNVAKSGDARGLGFRHWLKDYEANNI